MNGDNYLSVQDRALWSLVYSTIERFACCTVFRKVGPFAPARKDCTISFFVPKNHPEAAAVKAYLEHEAKGLIFVQRQTEEDWFPNTHVNVLLYSGLDPYLERDLIEATAERMVEAMVASVREVREGKKQKDDPDA